MDQLHGEKEEEEEHNVQDSTDHRRSDDDAAAEGADHGYCSDGYEAAEETAGVLKEVEVRVVGAGSSEEEDSPPPPLFARPCSLLQLLLRFCGGCLGLHVYCSDDDPKPAADAPAPESTAAVAYSPQEEGEGGERSSASYFVYVQEVVTRVWAVRRPPPPPGRPREGPGGNGGVHH